MIKVTIEDTNAKTHRTYEGSYALAFVMDNLGQGRWLQEPLQNNEGLSMFVAAWTAIKEVASISGDELYKVAARKALEEMDNVKNAKVVKSKPKAEET